MPQALIVDDDLNFLLGLAEVVTGEGFTARTARSLADARKELANGAPDIVLIDLNLPDGSGMELIEQLTSEPRPEIILITGHASVETAVDALRKGVADYLTKPVDFARVKTVLTNIARTRELREEIGALRGELRQLGRFGALIGGSPPMQAAYDLMAKVAPTDATVLLLGETGTGKEVAAQTIHRLSRRHKNVFLPLNCGAVSPTLIESELFGHERGSFTGADRVHRGFFERADRGTLFLDEITEMPAELQVKLLRVLETRSVTRIGGNGSMTVDVRVLAASNRSPEEAVSAGKLRADLHYRLNVFPISLPPLRDRGEDIKLLAEHFLGLLNKEEGLHKTFTRAALERLSGHDWPGNVRELRNVVHRAFIVSSNDIGIEALPLGAREESAESGLVVNVGTPIAEAERRLILATLENCGGDKKKAAEVLQISLKTLYNRLNAYRSA